jgi:alpha-amylase
MQTQGPTMPHVRLILALHNHQPVGNFDSVFEEAFRTSYLPFLEVLELYPEIPFALHTSGPLLEWLVDRRPDYVARVRALCAAGKVEILGGGFYEPILTMIPYRDRVGQIQAYSGYLKEIFGANVRGMWIPERVWEQHLVSAIVEAGIEYTVLDDFLFERAGCAGDEALGYYLTEDDGHLLKVFAGSETLRYSMPFQEPHITYEFLRSLAKRKPGATVVFADDGEKFGTWPKTFDHVYTQGWLRRFCDMVRDNSEWLEPTTFSRAVDSTLPLGKIYLPEGSYREMTEWALPADWLGAFRRAAHRLTELPDVHAVARFFRAGGYWRNFKARYPESDEMYARMLAVSRRLAAVQANAVSDPDYSEIARQELYRGQCNCPYWHGSFGGLYFPHLRNAIYRSLITADNALDDAEGLTGPRVSAQVGDFNLDLRQEVRLENDHLIALVRPACGGHIYELDIRHSAVNLLATLDRRKEAYHEATTAAALDQAGTARNAQTGENDPDSSSKRKPLSRRVLYDTHPRKALVDHFFPIDVTLEDLVACRPLESGDFVTGTYLAKIHREPDHVALVMERPGSAGGYPIRLRKTIKLRSASPVLLVHYELDELPRDVCLHFAAEINLAAMSGHAPDRYYSDPAGNQLGTLDAQIDALESRGLALTDHWLDLRVEISWSQTAGLWCFPIQTVSQSSGALEGIYQSSAVIPHWHITADEQGHWEVEIRSSVDHALPARSSSEDGRRPLASTMSS